MCVCVCVGDGSGKYGCAFSIVWVIIRGKCPPPPPPYHLAKVGGVLVRIFGGKGLIDRDKECQTFQALSAFLEVMVVVVVVVIDSPPG